jgi:hypothetical protein
MDIAIFGASGATGTLLTQRCLAAGHSVRALLRTPEKFPLRDQIRVIHGSPFNLASVSQTLCSRPSAQGRSRKRMSSSEAFLKSSPRWRIVSPIQNLSVVSSSSAQPAPTQRSGQAARMAPLDRPEHRLQHLPEVARSLADLSMERSLP